MCFSVNLSFKETHLAKKIKTKLLLCEQLQMITPLSQLLFCPVNGNTRISDHTNMQMNLIDRSTSIMAKNIDLSKIKCTGFQFVFDILDQKTLLNAFSLRRSYKTGNNELVRVNRNCTKC